MAVNLHGDTAYDGLTEAVDDPRWAFGTGFEDPLFGVDTTIPASADASSLAATCLALGDDALILSHRLQQWVARLPELEEETAVANIALDLLGQARLLLSRAGRADGTGRTEDDLAFLREQHDFRNVRLVEAEDRDFADLIGRLLIFSTWRAQLLAHLRDSDDPVLRAIATKAVKELTYHCDYAVQWTVRLGDGTDESHRRMQAALDRWWPFVDELFSDEAEREAFDAAMVEVFAEATLVQPSCEPAARINGRAGREGVHTQHLSYVLAELQSVARAHPGASW